MDATKKRMIRKVLLWVLLTPFVLFVLLMGLLYIPPVQQFTRKVAETVVSEATGYQVNIGRLDLRFPLNLLLRDVQMTQEADTLLDVESLSVKVQAWPLLHLRAEVDQIHLKNAKVDMLDLIDGVRVQGQLGDFELRSHGVNLKTDSAMINHAYLKDSEVNIQLVDKVLPEDTTETIINWVIESEQIALENVRVNFSIPKDTLGIEIKLGQTTLKDGLVDLRNDYYGVRSLLLADSWLRIDTDNDTISAGFDPSHIHLMNIQAHIDSVYYHGQQMNAVVNQFSLDERSGLSLTSLTGRFNSDDTQISVRQAVMTTPHSELTFDGVLPWSVLDNPSSGRMVADLAGSLGKEDVLLAVGNLPESFKNSYPFRPLSFNAGLQGNMQELEVSDLSASLPGAFRLLGKGDFFHLSDSLNRVGNLDFDLLTGDLNFLTALTGQPANGSLAIPDSLSLKATVGLRGQDVFAKANLREGQGRVDLDGTYNLATERYQVSLDVDSLQVDHFLPKDSIYYASGRMNAHGQGTDFTSPRAVAQLEGSLNALHYKDMKISNVNLSGNLKGRLLDFNIDSNNQLLAMRGKGTWRLGAKHTEGSVNVNIEHLDLQKLGIVSVPINHPMAFNIQAESGADSLYARIEGGDMLVMIRGQQSIEDLLAKGQAFDQLLMTQLKSHMLNHEELRETLPNIGLLVRAGKDNPVNHFLATKGLGFQSLRIGYGINDRTGINGRAEVQGLRIDSIRLDTISLAIRQDIQKVALHGAVINGKKNPQITFRSNIDGEIRTEDAELNLSFIDKRGLTGVQLGVNARPVPGELENTTAGLMMHLMPAEPIIGFRKFHFYNENDWIYWRNDNRIMAHVDLDGDDGLGIMVKSNDGDSLSLQNLDLELSRLPLSDLSAIFPYFPALGGLLSLDANYVQKATSMQVSAEGLVDALKYEGRLVGNVGLGATWLPGESQTHYIDTYFSCDNEEVMTAVGTLKQQGNNNLLDIMATIDQLPLRLFDAFMPDGMATFKGVLDGNMDISGNLDNPRMNGELAFDEVSVYSTQTGTSYRLDERPLVVNGSKILFDKFAIYTTADNPLMVDGQIDLSRIANPTANLNVQARNYTLLDAVKTKESLVYGKVYVDINAYMRGPLLDGPVLRGNMNVLGNTNATYVMTDSPLTVEDRMDGLVVFTSFEEEEEQKDEQAPALSLSGLDMLMTVHIDDAVRLRADLSTDRSKFVELTGGGDLSMQYKPQGGINMTGRYTITGGTMKYSLPIIPLKDFAIASGSYVEWRGDMTNPRLNLTATEKVSASVSNGGDNSGSRRVDFNVSVIIKNTLESPDVTFDMSAPNDSEVQNDLVSMTAEERGKQAVTMLATGIYLGSGMNTGEGLTMGTALNTMLQSQINALAGSAMGNASFSMDIENRTDGTSGGTLTDYSFRYSQRFFNDRVQINIGGKVTTGNNASNNADSFIDNVSLEYRVDKSGTRYLRAFHNKNYEDVLDGEITETGVGVLYRRRVDHLSELFIFKKKEDANE